jgi:hypothetical protein
MSLPFKVESWSRDGNKVDELLGELNCYGLAKAAFDAALDIYQGRPITIRQGIRVIEKSSEFRTDG